MILENTEINIHGFKILSIYGISLYLLYFTVSCCYSRCLIYKLDFTIGM